MTRSPLLSRRLAGLGTTIFAEMSARAQRDLLTGGLAGHPEAARTPVRFAFCQRPEVLTEALARLKTFLT